MIRLIARSPCTAQAVRPCLQSSLRGYDRRAYLKEKKRLKAQRNQEDVSFEDCMSLFRTYCLGQELPLSAHIQCLKPEDTTHPVTIRGQVTLPTQLESDSSETILVLAKGKQAEEARALGATMVGAEDVLERIQQGHIDFQRVLCTRELFPQVIKVAKILGPKGLMPSPARGTVSDDVASMMSSLKASSRFEADALGLVSLAVAKTNWEDAVIFENLSAFLNAVKSSRPNKLDASSFIQSMSISSPNTPALQLPRRPFRPQTD